MAKKKPKTAMQAYTKGIGKRTASPTIEQMESIKATAGRLGVAVPEVKTQQDADFVLDDLRRQERAARRSKES